MCGLDAQRTCQLTSLSSSAHFLPACTPSLAPARYQNPVLNAPLGPDGLPVPVDPKRVQEFFEVRLPAWPAIGALHAR